MREIKFRAWNKPTRIMLYWGFIVDIFNKGAADIRNFLPVHNAWMQYTGLKDRNGKEIYEGDVVVKPYIDPLGKMHIDTEDGRYKVGFEHGQFVIYLIEPRPLVNWCEKEKGEYVSNYGNVTIVQNKTVLKVIGNVWENPELLNK